ncbi:MAG: single-stranded DNA-binding protein [Eubacteriales bacterium]|nr:single-stranded DNA-binding protein [Eubacteriales bacterium]MDD4106011.1 single-stranded DNA-binding protein [Eubacteriales bacterium]
MNRIFLIGNLTRDPELRTTQNGTAVCSFTVAVNRRQSAQSAAQNTQNEADFFRVSAWRQLGENCNRFLAKGRKVGVVGTLTLQTFTGNDGQQRSSLEVQADEVEFLTPRSEQSGAQGDYKPQTSQQKIDTANGFVQVDEDDLPF